MHASFGWVFSRNTWSANARKADFSSGRAAQLTLQGLAAFRLIMAFGMPKKILSRVEEPHLGHSIAGSDKFCAACTPFTSTSSLTCPGFSGLSLLGTRFRT
jgi:hypothetical protein